MKAAEKRNRERQRIEERKIEKERVKEGDQFSDKPQFVTSAYRKRMQEREKEEEEERRMAAIEGKGYCNVSAATYLWKALKTGCTVYTVLHKYGTQF